MLSTVDLPAPPPGSTPAGGEKIAKHRHSGLREPLGIHALDGQLTNIETAFGIVGKPPEGGEQNREILVLPFGEHAPGMHDRLPQAVFAVDEAGGTLERTSPCVKLARCARNGFGRLEHRTFGNGLTAAGRPVPHREGHLETARFGLRAPCVAPVERLLRVGEDLALGRNAKRDGKRPGRVVGKAQMTGEPPAARRPESTRRSRADLGRRLHQASFTGSADSAGAFQTRRWTAPS